MSKSLVLKVVSSEMKSYGGFQWPGVGGKATAEDWQPTKECTNGLHGWLNGVGGIDCQSWSQYKDAKWLVLSVDTAQIIDLGGKVKFPEAEVIYVGGMSDAAQVILNSGFAGPVIGASIIGGNSSTLTGGHRSSLTGGDESTLTGGNGSTLTGGNGSMLTGGDESTLTGGDCSILQISYYYNRKRIATAYVGEDGILPNVPYKLDSNYKFVEVKGD